jgi:sulfonate transport system substrate-binding protein
VLPALLAPTAILAAMPPVAVQIAGDYHRAIAETSRRQTGDVMKVLRSLMLACLAALVAGDALAQADLRAPLPQPLKIKQGMLNVPALSSLWLLPEQAAKYNIQIEMVMFQRFADARTALVSGDIHLAAFGPQDISLALGQGAKSLVGVAGVGSGNDCLLVRKGEDIKDWKSIADKRIGIGAGSISWLKFAAGVQENGLQYNGLKIVNIVGGGANYTRALQSKEIDMAVVWQPFCAQAIVDGYGAYATLDHNRTKTVGGLIAVLAVNRTFMEKNRDAVQRLVVSYIDALDLARKDMGRWARIYAEKAGLPENVAAEAIRTTQLDARLPLETIKRISKFLSDNGVITRDVSGEIGQHYDYDFLAKATGKSSDQLGLKE